MGPEIGYPQIDCGLNRLRSDLAWLISAFPSLCKILESTREPQNVRSTFAEPFPFPSVELCLFFMDEEPKCLKFLHRLFGEPDCFSTAETAGTAETCDIFGFCSFCS